MGGGSAALRVGTGTLCGLALLLFVSLLPGPLHPAPLLAAPGDDYAFLLAKSVKEDGVDYKELAAGRAALDAYVRSLATAEPGATDPDRIAFWINAYDALTLQQVLDTKPKSGEYSVRDVKGFFDGRTWTVAGREVTLDGIEKGILREFKEPLVHFALHRGSRSSPPLAAVLYRSRDLPEALAQQARAYLDDKEQNVFEYAQLRAELSMIFFWHREDFEAGRKGDVPPLQLFLADHMPREKEEVARSLRKTAWRISFRPYDWSLDEAGGRRPVPVHPVWIALYAIAATALLLFGFRAFRMLVRRDSVG